MCIGDEESMSIFFSSIPQIVIELQRRSSMGCDVEHGRLFERQSEKGFLAYHLSQMRNGYDHVIASREYGVS